jgi:hypothetical protein
MAIGKDSLRAWLHAYPMEIQKRSMNWLPKVGVYQEMQMNRAKRADANARVDAQMAQASAMIGSNTDSTEAVNLTLRIAAARVQTGIKPKV